LFKNGIIVNVFVYDFGGRTLSKNKGIARGLAMITQVGISMMVPIFLCVAIGIILDKKLNARYFTIIFLILGILAGARNTYVMIMSNVRMDSKNMNQNENTKITGRVQKVIKPNKGEDNHNERKKH